MLALSGPGQKLRGQKPLRTKAQMDKNPAAKSPATFYNSMNCFNMNLLFYICIWH